jgi:hypothetical protein
MTGKKVQRSRLRKVTTVLSIGAFDWDANRILGLVHEERGIGGHELTGEACLLGLDHPRVDTVTLPDAQGVREDISPLLRGYAICRGNLNQDRPLPDHQA